jgi:protoheme IX farnesyltransferase
LNPSKTYKLGLGALVFDIGQLVKFKLSLMVVFSSLACYLVFAGENFNSFHFFLLLSGGLFITFSANAINQVLERDYDKLMVRTRLRPLADNRMSVSVALLIAGIFSILGAISLALISPLCATLGMISLVLYAFVYTPLKRYSTLAIPVGAIPGALPALVAGVAAQQTISLEGFCLFGIQYLWQFPHFWAIAWLGHQDYKQAGFKLIRDEDGMPDRSYGLYSAFYALAGILLILPLFVSHYLSPYLFFTITLVMIVYAYFSYLLYKKNDRQSARMLMFCSIIYLPVILSLFILNNHL